MAAPLTFDFDTVVERRDTNCYKWDLYGDDVLPLWVADMDFQSPQVVVDRIKQRADHGIFGYTPPPKALKEAIVQRMKERYDWTVDPEHLVFNPGMVLMLNVVAQTVGKAGDGILMQTPVYGPFLTVPSHRGRFANTVDMKRVDQDNNIFSYEIDYSTFEAGMTKQTSLFYLCNPHNPVGRAFRRDELQQMADLCLKHDVVICEDAIHSDLLMDDNNYTPIASLSPEIAQQTITLIAPSKTFNIPGLALSIAIIPNDELRQKMTSISQMSGYHADILAYEAGLAAYQEGGAWLEALLAYLTENRDTAVKFIQEELPMLKTTVPEATYLQWIDCSGLDVGERTYQEFFVQEAKVALNPGQFFGSTATDFVRLNFGCPRSTLLEALERMKAAILKL